MNATSHQFAAGGIGLCASLAMVAIAALVLLRRAESASLFVEDRWGYLAAKAVAAAVIAFVGIQGFLRSLEFLLTK